MKNNITGILSIAFVLLIVISCRKDRADEYYHEDPPKVKPDLSIRVTTSVAGFIVDENNSPVYNVQISAGIKNAVTDEFGYFEIKDVSLPEVAGFVRATKTNYFTSYKTFIPEAGKQSFVRIQLMPKSALGNIDAATGGSASLANGAKVTLPSNSVVIAQGGASYSGPVNVALHWIDPTNIAMQQKSRPGDSRGLDMDEHLTYLQSYGTIAVELTGSAGQSLQIADGKKAKIELPIKASQLTTAPNTIKLWSLDENNGLWKEEAIANKVGQTYIGEVSHFSFWDGAVSLPTVSFTVQVVDEQLHPLANTPIGIRYSNQSFNTGGGTFGFTDANGVAHGAVPANANLVMSVLTPCEIEAYAHNFSSGNSSIDLGTITGNLGQGLVTITGTVLGCNNQQVTNGYIQTFENGLYNRSEIVNGNFSFTGIGCTNTSTNIIVVDRNTNQQGPVLNIPLISGVNNLGTLTACGTSTVGTISYSINGTPFVLNEPSKTLSGYYTTSGGGWTTILDVAPSGNSRISFQFDGQSLIGNLHKVTDIFCTDFSGGRAIAPVPLTVNITEFGAPGGFIAGELSGLVLDFVSNAPYDFNCQFRVRRNN